MADTPSPPPDLLASREGTGTRFPAAMAEHARTPGALGDATAWGAAADPGTRQLGLELAAVLAGPASPLASAARPDAVALAAVLARAAAGDADADLRWAAAKALGSIGPLRAIGSDGADPVALLAGLARDPDADVRFQAVSSLPLLAGDPPREDAVAALVAACSDPAREVAEQAVFALAEQLEPAGAAASGAVADALAGALAPGAPREAAASAAVGLARRGDPRALPAVRAELAAAAAQEAAAADLDPGWLQAAAELADPALAGDLAVLAQAPGAEHVHAPAAAALEAVSRRTAP